jgi:hypothetical protein
MTVFSILRGHVDCKPLLLHTLTLSRLLTGVGPQLDGVF